MGMQVVRMNDGNGFLPGKEITGQKKNRYQNESS
jgi:hypothetical protein